MSEPIIAQAIQLAIAPVFLLTGIAALLGVMTNRLARVVDRTRFVEQTWAQLDEPAHKLACDEMTHLERRRRLASWAINCSTAAALVICMVIVTIFADQLFSTNLSSLVGVLFILALLALIGGLSSFLREVYLATQGIQIETIRFQQRLKAGSR